MQLLVVCHFPWVVWEESACVTSVAFFVFLQLFSREEYLAAVFVAAFEIILCPHGLPDRSDQCLILRQVQLSPLVRARSTGSR